MDMAVLHQMHHMSNQSQISSIESSEAGVDGNATKYLKVFANLW